jgi:inhibitor of KinA sporulation pathway (predicted exonuclease)
MPWNINFAKSCNNGILHKTFCKDLLTISQKHTDENTVQIIDPGVFPFDDLIIKI